MTNQPHMIDLREMVEKHLVPKTVRGNWEPIVTTEEFERGQDILAKRNAHRTVKRKQFYLLTGLAFYR